LTDTAVQLGDALRGRYVIERELGRGGMATVFLAHDLKHDRPVALKVLLPELAATVGPERFEREIKLAARLQHPHILTVLDSGEAGGLLWFTMPYVEGHSLRDRLHREHQLPVEEALRIAREAAAALDYAHEHGARLLEAYPVEVAGGTRVPPGDAYRGTLSMFENASFKIAARRTTPGSRTTRPIVRRAIRRSPGHAAG